MNTITFDIARYANEEEFWADISKTIQILTTNSYDIQFRYEDCGIYVLNYDYVSTDLAHDKLIWLSMDEYEDFISYMHRNNEI